MIQGSGDDNNDADHADVEPPIKMSVKSDSEESSEGSANGSEEDDHMKNFDHGENFELPEVGN